jgi:dTDP-4-amino-4,6-dideoxygalactose transaminase
LSDSWIPHSEPTLDRRDADALSGTVLRGHVGAGERVKEFEKRVAQYLGRRHAIATSSGSAALTLALRALGLQAGARVVIPAIGCRALLNAVMTAGAVPVLADIESVDLTLSYEAAQPALEPTVGALILPHMFGAPADVPRFRQLGVPLVEDAASSPGAILDGKPVGSLGDVAILSFGSTKMLTSGSGGMLLTDDLNIAEEARALLDYDGESSARRENGSYRVGFNEGMNDLAATLGLSQFERLDAFVARRRQIALYYLSRFAGIERVGLPETTESKFHSFYRFILRVREDARPIVAGLQGANIDARGSVTHYLYSYLDGDSRLYPTSARIRNHIVSLPIYPGLTDGQVMRIADCFKSLLDEIA